MKTVQILMSTYNGEKYLREQIDSILEQDCEEKGIAKVKLLIRDDGSTDNTQHILREYSEKFSGRVEWYQGENKGVIGSFFDLLQKSEMDADYFGFADQDDFWLSEKIRTGIEHLEQESSLSPNLYCCRFTPVDEHLQELKSNIHRPPMRPSFGNALVENIVAGCTILMNGTLKDLILVELPKYTVMHDWWCYLTASFYGNVYFDEQSYILYRQHGENAVGSNVSRWKEFVGRIKRYQGNRGNISHQMEEFLRIYQGQKMASAIEEMKLQIDEEKIQLAKQLIEGKKSIKTRVKLVQGGEIYRQRKTDDQIFKVIILKGSY
ncbi:MAG: glycosyltransferase family 2 protein [Lachnospiraceae bacterium]|nr:glycosyltransferase family 2 protein [Lachnospiraceae bacterium]